MTHRTDKSSASTNAVLQHAGRTVFAIAPYQPGRPSEEVAAERGIADVIKLASNENPIGAGAAAQRVLNAMPNEGLSRYPDGGCERLRAAVAERLQVRPQQLIFGNGSNEILELAAQLVLSPNNTVVFSAHAFVVYGLAAAARRAKTIECPPTAPACPPAFLPAVRSQNCNNNYGCDLDALAAATQEDGVRLIYLANPNNPTGSWHPPERITAFMQKVPPDVLVVLDEAYREYADGGDSLPTTMFPNLLITRTFSKIHGLAGLRAGFGVGEESLIDMLNRIRQPFNLGAAAQAAALAALDDGAHVARSFRLNQEGMAQCAAGLDALNLQIMPSRANFITFAVPPTADAMQIYDGLLNDGVIVRPLGGYALPNWLRVTIGREAENARFLQALAVQVTPFLASDKDATAVSKRA